jgi:hypothetical protein
LQKIGPFETETAFAQIPRPISMRQPLGVRRLVAAFRITTAATSKSKPLSSADVATTPPPEQSADKSAHSK